MFVSLITIFYDKNSESKDYIRLIIVEFDYKIGSINYFINIRWLAKMKDIRLKIVLWSR